VKEDWLDAQRWTRNVEQPGPRPVPDAPAALVAAGPDGADR
jgi:hypothetical protein